MGRAPILLMKDVCYPILAVFALPANLLTIIILFRGNCGLSDCICAYMTIMAMSDLSVIVIHVVVHEVLIPRLPHTFLHYTSFRVAMAYLMVVSLDLSKWYTVAFTFDRYVAMCCQTFKTKYCKVKTVRILAAAILILISLENIPYLFVFQPLRIVGNISWGIEFNLHIISSPAFVAFTRFKVILGTLGAFGLMFLFNGLTVRNILVASTSRKNFQRHKGENYRDREIESRRKSIILLFSVSGTFMLLSLTTSVNNFIHAFSLHSGRDDYSPAFTLAHTGYLLTRLSSCTDTCIYAVTQTKFREELKSLILSPCRIILALSKKL